jgi:UDP-glucose 4-epimerase
MRVLLTGGSGFVGRAVLKTLATAVDVQVVAALRKELSDLPAGVTYYQIPDLGAADSWPSNERSIDVVIHCASRVHVMNEVAADPLAEFRRVNVEGTLKFAKSAAAAGV